MPKHLDSYYSLRHGPLPKKVIFVLLPAYLLCFFQFLILLLYSLARDIAIQSIFFVIHFRRCWFVKVFHPVVKIMYVFEDEILLIEELKSSVFQIRTSGLYTIYNNSSTINLLQLK